MLLLGERSRREGEWRGGEWREVGVRGTSRADGEGREKKKMQLGHSQAGKHSGE